MIIDSHAHYANNCYKKPFRYLTRDENGYALEEGELPQLIQQMEDAGIRYFIEPAVHLAACEEVLELAKAYPGKIFPTVGVHPTRAIFESWPDRKKLAAYAQAEGVIAIGECGLDYHYKREEQHRLKQYAWFLYQLDLAWKAKLPVVYHVRDAHEDAIRILKRHPARKLGGVIHCFNGSKETAQQYVDLGFHLGIGASILQQEERAKELWEVVSVVPLERILVETDAPFILPYCKDTLPAKLLRRTRNSSLILPEVIRKIAQLKGLSYDAVQQATTQNVIRLFALPIRDF